MDPRAQQGTLPGRGAQAPVPRPPQEMGPRKPASLQTLCPCACSGNQIPRVGVGAGKVLSQIKWYLGRQTSLGTILTFPVWSRVISAASIWILSFLNFEFFLGLLRHFCFLFFFFEPQDATLNPKRKVLIFFLCFGTTVHTCVGTVCWSWALGTSRIQEHLLSRVVVAGSSLLPLCSLALVYRLNDSNPPSIVNPLCPFLCYPGPTTCCLGNLRPIIRHVLASVSSSITW